MARAATMALFAGATAAAQAGAPAHPAPPAVTAPPATPIQTPAEALAQDAAEYARRYDVPLIEATHRLQAQEESVATTDRLQEQYGDRLAGLYIEHRPVYRIVVFLTGTDPVPDQSLFAGGMTVPIVFRTGAPASRVRILGAIAQHQTEIRNALPTPPGMGVDPRSGMLLVMVEPSDLKEAGADALKARLEAIAGVPVRIREMTGADKDLRGANRPSRDPQDVDLAGVVPGGADLVEGGSRVQGVNPTDGKTYYCTTGFVVTDNTQSGVLTAAHCADTMNYFGPDHREIPMQFSGQWGWGYQDVQLHLTDRALQPLFFADTKRTLLRPVTGARSRTSTRVGDFVCHRGERTGYSCAPIELVDFAPAGDLCGGPCLPTWVTVAGPTCKAGDSGAPVFIGTIAFGLVKGASYRGNGNCISYYYMSTDYLPSGWSLRIKAPVMFPTIAHRPARHTVRPRRPVAAHGRKPVVLR